MEKENSYGIIPLCIKQNQWYVLLIQHQAEHWGFPKGHANPGESPQQAAERELQEETGLTIQRFLSPDPFFENYFFTSQNRQIFKTVLYFLALVQGQANLQNCEIKSSQWLLLSEAEKHITFKESKNICLQVSNFLNKHLYQFEKF